jgi:prepilin-type N-terminal cleavage/methylation domain-containing protein
MRRAQAGYTLVELLVSILLTSIVVTALYGVSRTATETFNQQQHTAEMQLRLRFAMEQLRADVSRAGYMGTPNSVTDTRVCPRPTTTYQALEILRTTPNPTVLPSDNANINPITLRMTGNYVTADEYSVAGVSGSTLSLQNQSPQWARVLSQGEFDRIFGTAASPRLLRIMSTSGQMQFAVSMGGTWVAANSTGLPTVLLTTVPLVQGAGASASSAGAGCGLSGLGVGATVAPMMMVEYEIGSLATRLVELYPVETAARAAKTDLIRREYDLRPAPAEIVTAARLVGEYAVDFDATVAYDIGNPVNSIVGQPAMRTLAFGDANITNLVGSAGGSAARPQQVRSLIVRMSIRDRDQDPGFGWVPRGLTAPLTRFRVFDTRIGAARVRSLITEIAVPNLAIRNLR